MFINFQNLWRDFTMRLGLVVGIPMSVVVITGYLALRHPNSTVGPFGSVGELWFLFFDRPIWHHVLLVTLPSAVGGIAVTEITRRRSVNGAYSDNIRALAVQFLSLPIVAALFGLSLAYRIALFADTFLLLIFIVVFLLPILLTFMTFSLPGIAVGYFLSTRLRNNSSG